MQQLAPKNPEPEALPEKLSLIERTESIARLKWLKDLSLLNLFAGAFCLIYAYGFWKSVSKYWFHPNWSTDDALQQAVPFHAVYKPEIFQSDYIFEVMTGYLAPLHYWICYAVTWLAGDPIMMGHWVMLIQLVVTVTFLFLAVRTAAGTAPAFFSVAWFIHTRHIVQRLTAGLPRGWAACIFAAFFYFALKRNHKGMLLTLLAGCLLHPPATMLIAVAYGLVLSWKVLLPKSRQEYLKPFLILIILSPLYIATTFYVVDRPDHVGDMVSLEEAAEMPEFQRPSGRFPFVPLRSISQDINTFGYQAFLSRFHNPGRFWKRNMPTIVGILFLGLILGGLIRRRKTIPPEVFFFLVSIAFVYLASREFAFKLYVPNRHIQFPMAMFFITAFSIGVWRLFHRSASYQDMRLKVAWPSALAVIALGWVIYSGGGLGFNGTANFNYSLHKRGKLFVWIEKNIPEDALVAGHPTFIDGVPLFAKRKVLATTETWHPFYKGYNQEIERRIEISLRAHYAKDLRELVQILQPANVDYFVFERQRFYPEALQEAKYFPPFQGLIDKITSRHYLEFAYRELPREMDLDKYPCMVFKDQLSVIVDVNCLSAEFAASNIKEK